MRKFFFWVFLVASLANATPAAADCFGVDRNLTDATKAQLAPIVTAQLNTPTGPGQLKTSTVDVLESFHSRGWTILYVDTHVSDRAFLFYRKPPVEERFVTLWSGAARFDEEDGLRHWVHINAPGIPSRLANCFTWYVTQGRGR